MENGAGPKPPWGGYGSFWNFVSKLRDEDGGIPQVLDRSIMANRGGSARTELYAALRFFLLIDDDKRPTDTLRMLAENPTPERMRAIVEICYEPVIDLGLATATATQVGDALVGMGATPSTVVRARTFFLNAADHTGIPIGNTLKTKRAPSTTPRRRSRSKKTGVGTPSEQPEEQRPKLPPVIGALVAKLPEGDWSEAEARQWLGLVAPAIAYDYELDLTKLQSSSSGGAS